MQSHWAGLGRYGLANYGQDGANPTVIALALLLGPSVRHSLIRGCLAFTRARYS